MTALTIYVCSAAFEAVRKTGSFLLYVLARCDVSSCKSGNNQIKVAQRR